MPRVSAALRGSRALSRPRIRAALPSQASLKGLQPAASKQALGADPSGGEKPRRQHIAPQQVGAVIELARIGRRQQRPQGAQKVMRSPGPSAGCLSSGS